MLQRIREFDPNQGRALYLSADSVLLGDTSLYELAHAFFVQRGGEYLFIDEIHRHRSWSQQIKTIYDSIPRLSVVFSGSSQINILKGRSDLARRAVLYPMAGLSFREFLELEKQFISPPLTLQKLIAEHASISTQISGELPVLKLFDDYLHWHYYPYYREHKSSPLYLQQILNSIDKAVFEDVALLFNLRTENMIVFREILAFLASITPGEFSVHKVAKNLGKKDDTIKHYLQILHDASLVRFLPRSAGGHAALKAAVKIFLENPNMLHALCSLRGIPVNEGLLRESFMINQLQAAGLIPVHSKSGDLQVESTVFEIGGPGKTRRQLKSQQQAFVVSDDILASVGEKIPLYLFGLLY
jgi:predicted AAA+ superfamily ATPase